MKKLLLGCIFIMSMFIRCSEPDINIIIPNQRQIDSLENAINILLLQEEADSLQNVIDLLNSQEKIDSLQSEISKTIDSLSFAISVQNVEQMEALYNQIDYLSDEIKKLNNSYTLDRDSLNTVIQDLVYTINNPFGDRLKLYLPIVDNTYENMDTTLLNIINNNNPFSIAMRFRTENHTNNHGFLMEIAGNNTGPYRRMILRAEGGKIAFIREIPGNNLHDFLYTNSSYTDGNWYLVVIKYDGINMTINMDVGKEIVVMESLDDFEVSTDDNNRLSIGHSFQQQQQSGFLFNGEIKDVYIFNNIITNEEISNL